MWHVLLLLLSKVQWGSRDHLLQYLFAKSQARACQVIVDWPGSGDRDRDTPPAVISRQLDGQDWLVSRDCNGPGLVFPHYPHNTHGHCLAEWEDRLECQFVFCLPVMTGKILPPHWLQSCRQRQQLQCVSLKIISLVILTQLSFGVSSKGNYNGTARLLTSRTGTSPWDSPLGWRRIPQSGESECPLWSPGSHQTPPACRLSAWLLSVFSSLAACDLLWRFRLYYLTLQTFASQTTLGVR